jgi:hypothetical protein
MMSLILIFMLVTGFVYAGRRLRGEPGGKNTVEVDGYELEGGADCFYLLKKERRF